MNRSILSASVLALLALPQVAAAQASNNSASEKAANITRYDSVVRGRQFARHRWHASAANISPTQCPAGFDWYGGAAGTQTYQQVSSHYVGDFVGLPYNWGGMMPLRKFDELVAQGMGAGAGASTRLEAEGGHADCTMGVDCSGFVSQAWRADNYYTTSAQGSISAQLSNVGQMRAGDSWNQAGYHTAIFTQTLANGIPESVESINYNVNINRYGGYSGVGQFVPRKYNGMNETTAGVGPLAGSIEQPIVIAPSSTTDVNTKVGASAYGSYGCAPGTPQLGPEIVFQVTFAEAGTFRATLTDDAQTDLDVHILTQLNTSSCIARDNAVATVAVGPGTYYVIVDTHATTTSATNPTQGGAGELITTFTAGAGGTSPAAFEPKGGAGEECSDSIFCDVNRGGEACLTAQSGAFCSKACSANSDCADMAGGAGCCGVVEVKDSQGNVREENYCFIASFCEGGQPSSSGLTSGGTGTSGSSGKGNSGGTGGGDDDQADDDVSADDDTTTTSGGKSSGSSGSSEGGCAASPGASTTSTLLLVGLGLVGLAARRRVRTH